jgi:hypothetical protein
MLTPGGSGLARPSAQLDTQPGLCRIRGGPRRARTRLLYRSSRLNSSETDVPTPGHRRNATLAGTDRSISWPLQTPAAHLSRLSTGTTTIPTSISRDGGGRYGASFGSACQARPGPPADQPGMGSAQWDLCSYDRMTRPLEAVGRLPRDTIESSTRTVVPCPFGLWIVIVPLDAPGLVGRRDDPCPGSANSAWASPREPAIVLNARSGVRISPSATRALGPGYRRRRAAPPSLSYGVPRSDAIVLATKAFAGDTQRPIK